MANKPRHHIFPQEERGYFEDRGFRDATDIDEFTVELDEAFHQAIHTGREQWDKEWNTRLMTTLRTQEEFLGRRLTVDEIWSQARTLMEEYKIPMDFVRYRERRE